MKLLLLTIVLISFISGCNKTQENIAPTCFKGKYIGNGCWPVIQILEPIDKKLKESRWETDTMQYDYAVGTGALPDKYKDSNPFYFTISGIDSNIVHTANCSIPKFTISINTFSDSACKISKN